jgi:F-type H+-transporting ATPase subunit b
MARSLRSGFAALLGACALVTPLLALAAPAAGHGDAHSGAEHGAKAAAHGGHEQGGAGAHGGHGDPQINWVDGLLGEKEGAEPSLLWRPPGTPPPYAANLLNTLALAFVLFKLAKGPVVDGLRSRREKLLKGIDDASRMKAEAEKSLAEYRRKLENIDSEIERVRQEMRESNEAERRRILAEAEQRRERVENEARVLVEQELSALQEQLRRETVAAALRSARDLLKAQTSGEDQRRLGDAFLQDLRLRSEAAARASTGGGQS